MSWQRTEPKHLILYYKNKNQQNKAKIQPYPKITLIYKTTRTMDGICIFKQPESTHGPK